MKLNDFIKFIRESGCRTRIYKNKWTVKNINGYFDIDKKGRPILTAALSGHSESSKMELLAHEYGHYLQYLDDMTNPAEEYDCYGMQEKWLKGKIELSSEELKECRNMILDYEWDADMRALKLGSSLALEPWNAPNLIRGAKSYNATIKWSFDARLPFHCSIGRHHFNSKMLTADEVLAPLTIAEFRKFDKLVRFRNHDIF
jgi:hypothetical protein